MCVSESIVHSPEFPHVKLYFEISVQRAELKNAKRFKICWFAIRKLYRNEINSRKNYPPVHYNLKIILTKNMYFPVIG